MPYASAQEIVDRYGLDYLLGPSDDNCDGLPDDPKVALALSDATAEIDKFLSVRFQLPLVDIDTNPAWGWIKRCCIDLAIYYMAQTWASMTTLIEKRYEDCMLQLKRIADGEINVGGPTTSQGAAIVCAEPRIMTRKGLCGVL